jgi:hypothetical protein
MQPKFYTVEATSLQIQQDKNMKNLVAACLALLFAGCTSIQVRPVDSALAIRHVCIQKNEKVIVDDFLPVLEAGFARHGIATEVFSATPPARCEYILTYTARLSWDFVTYLAHAELWLENRERKRIAQATYHLVGGGGLSLMKWQSVQTKMDPVIDQLLAGQSAKTVAAKAPSRPVPEPVKASISPEPSPEPPKPVKAAARVPAGQGIHSYEVESQAIAAGCTAADGLRPEAVLIQQTDTLELYDIACRSQHMMVRCEYQVCSLLK